MPHPKLDSASNSKVLSLEHLLERLALNELSDENLWLLRDYCASINKRFENSPYFRRHLDYFISNYGFAPRTIANNIQQAYDNNQVPPYVSPSEDNSGRMALIDILISNIPARKKLLEMQRGYIIQTFDDPDELLYSGFSKETARTFIDNFEKYLNENKDSIEALRIIYNAQDIIITHSMLIELRDSLLAESKQFGIYQIWKNYKILDEDGDVDDLDIKTNFNALTNLIQIVRYAYRRNQRLTSLINGFAKRFSLYCGQAQRILTDDQRELMRRIAEYVINDGAISLAELNEADTDLWRNGIILFGPGVLADEMQAMAKILLKSA